MMSPRLHAPPPFSSLSRREHGSMATRTLLLAFLEQEQEHERTFAWAAQLTHRERTCSWLLLPRSNGSPQRQHDLRSGALFPRRRRRLLLRVCGSIISSPTASGLLAVEVPTASSLPAHLPAPGLSTRLPSRETEKGRPACPRLLISVSAPLARPGRPTGPGERRHGGPRLPAGGAGWWRACRA